MPKKRLLIIGYVWPEPKSSAAGSRMMELIALFNEQGYQITFASAAQLSDHMADLTAYNVDCINIALNCSSFDTFVKELAPSIVIYDRFMMEEQFGWRVEQHCPTALTILDTEDLHTLRYARHDAYKNAREVNVQDLTSDMAKREIASIYRCDLTLMISEAEIELLIEHYQVPAKLLHYIPFMLDIDRLDEPRPDYTERIDFISIGNFRHAPNWDAVRYLKESIWPLIRQELPKAKLNVYGAYPPPKATQLHNEKQGFLIKGWCDDAHAEIKKAKVLLAPLRFGAGIKGKLADAMINGTPNVTTNIGCESMHGQLPWAGEVSDEPEEFAKRAIALYQDRDSWSAYVSNGDAIIRALYNKTELAKELMNRVNELIDNLNGHRLDNFTGCMLKHHHHKSTKYMSQWIEAKNKD
ncbi:MAG: glycosyltransferase [Psychrobium sp.]